MNFQFLFLKEAILVDVNFLLGKKIKTLINTFLIKFMKFIKLRDILNFMKFKLLDSQFTFR